MRRAFTLIELMIVITIIGIIVAVALPHLFESRKSANEGQVVANLKAYVNAQGIYQANNYSMLAANGGDGTQATAHSFADSWQRLGGSDDTALQITPCATDANGTFIQLIPPVFAQAQAPASAYNGYYYADGISLPAGHNRKFNFCLSSMPAAYGTTGTNTFLVSEIGVVLMRDNSGMAPSADYQTLAQSGDWISP